MKKDNKGFSLVELLIAIAISSIVLMALVMLITQAVRSYTKQTALAQIQRRFTGAAEDRDHRAGAASGPGADAKGHGRAVRQGCALLSGRLRDRLFQPLQRTGPAL